MAWTKSPPELIERFQRALPDDPQVERRSMFGFPCAFVQGHMFAGLCEDRLFIRLPDARRTALLRQPGARPFEPRPGRVMREYVELPRPSTNPRIAAWLLEAMRYAAGLPPKPAKATARSGSKVSARRPARTRR